MERLDKTLSKCGFGSRKEVKEIIRGRCVTVNGEIVKDSSLLIEPIQDILSVNGETVKYKEFIYLMLNKPKGVVTATSDGKHTTVLSFVPNEFSHYNVFPVGRLDYDTEGLLILTNDGQMAHNLITPKKHIGKTYYVILSAPVHESLIEHFKEGVVLDDGYKTLPSVLKIGNPKSKITLTIYEGKFHQVKRMFKAFDLKVLYLQRIKINGLALDENLKPGEIRELTLSEIKLLAKGDEEYGYY